MLLRLPVPCNCARKSSIISWSCQYRYMSNLLLKVLVLLAITIQFGKLFQASTTLLVKQNLRKSYLKRVMKILRSLYRVAGMPVVFKCGTTFVSYFPESTVSYKFLSYLLLPAYNARLTLLHAFKQSL